jgi:hypothetical protein
MTMGIMDRFKKPINTNAMNNIEPIVIKHFDVKKAQNFYKNEEPGLELAGGFVKTTIDYTTAFVGTPFITDSQGNQDAIMKDFSGRKSDLMIMTRDSILEELVYVRVEAVNGDAYSDEKMVIFDILANDRVKPLANALGHIIGYKVVTTIALDMEDLSKKYTLTETITKKEIIMTRVGAVPAELKKTETIPNPYGILNIVPIINEPDKNGQGMSDIAPIMAYLQIYHNIAEQAVQYLYLHSDPKIKMKIKDWNKFLEINGGIVDKTNNTINIPGGAVFRISEVDDVAYIQPVSAMGDFTDLLQYMFYNIVQVSQTPEFLLGVAIASSKASADSQMITIDIKTSRKRTLFNDQFKQLYKVFATVYGKLNNIVPNVTDIVIDWDNVQASAKGVSDTLAADTTMVAATGGGG